VTMRCPRLYELPPPPDGKTGWPWNEETPPLPEILPDGAPWPRISIVTPSYNQAAFLEETIRSVLLQGYPNLEYIIMDGGSNDGSVDIIKKYAPHLEHWASEPDRGQSHAINKGWERATGAVVAFLNSDDLYLPSALRDSVTYLHEHAGTDMMYAYCQDIDQDGAPLELKGPGEFDLRLFLDSCYIRQPTVFLRRSLRERVGYLDESLYYALDYDYWLRSVKFTTPGRLAHVTACARYHADAKSTSDITGIYRDQLGMFDRMFGDGTLPQGDPVLTRAAYLPCLVFLSGLANRARADERAEALARLRNLDPRPTSRELSLLIAGHDAYRDSPYLSTCQDVRDLQKSRVSVDAYQILPSLVANGIASEAMSRNVRGRLEAYAAFRGILHSGEESDSRVVLLRLIRVCALCPWLLSTRVCWKEFARATAIGLSLLPIYRIARDTRRSLLQLLRTRRHRISSNSASDFPRGRTGQAAG